VVRRVKACVKMSGRGGGALIEASGVRNYVATVRLVEGGVEIEETGYRRIPNFN